MFFQTLLQVDCPRCRAMAEFRENCAKARLVFPRLGKEPIELIDPQLAVRSGGHVLINVLTLASVISLYFIRITLVIPKKAATLRFLANIFYRSRQRKLYLASSPRPLRVCQLRADRALSLGIARALRTAPRRQREPSHGRGSHGGLSRLPERVVVPSGIKRTSLCLCGRAELHRRAC